VLLLLGNEIFFVLIDWVQGRIFENICLYLARVFCSSVLTAKFIVVPSLCSKYVKSKSPERPVYLGFEIP
jgi:hypothetical protein